MQAFLIDPRECTIKAVEYTGDYREIYKHIGAECFDAARFNDTGDAVFIDDEGLLRDGLTPRDFFQIEGYPTPLAGKGLVLGCDDEGESIAPSVTENWLLDHVLFCLIDGGPIQIVQAARGFREAQEAAANTAAATCDDDDDPDYDDNGNLRAGVDNQ